MLPCRLIVLVGMALLTGCRSDDDDCPGGQTKRNVCVACGPAGGCSEQSEMCVPQCQGPADCSGALIACVEGVCQLTGCE